MKIYLVSFLIGLFLIGCGGESTGSSDSATSGISGSMARFSIVGDNLYSVTGEVMNVFDISDASNPQRVSRTLLDFDVETIFSYKSYLYLGAASGVYIYDINITTQPTKIADFTHAQSCDPVVVVDDIAYVTLNTSSSCFRTTTGQSRLEIVNVKDPKNPTLIRAIDMWAPTGLALSDNKLFICDGSDGLKVFDVNKSEENTTVDVRISSLETKQNINCYDLIANDNTLYVSNRNEINQFDYAVNPMSNYGTIK
ncbi:MAG: hypothetical protein U9N39_10460 [Campylobacterota bacterium]|nr:hypothetical protein [Campylobacterota bacterium]